MPPLLRDHQDDLAALIASAAAELGVDPAFVEKDVWVTEVLRSLYAEPYAITTKDGEIRHLRVVFKGGTSLSKAFGLLERFSEDVDILLVFPEGETSINARDEALRAITESVSRHLSFGEDKIVAERSSRGIKRDTRFLYPRLAAVSTAVSTGILLEMGSRGGSFPTRTATLRSLVSEHAQRQFGDSDQTWSEFAPFEVEVLSPERTAIEKLSLLHDLMSRDLDDTVQGRVRTAGRHLYDLHRLLQSAPVIDALSALGQQGVAELCRDVEEHSAAAGFAYTARPAAGFAASPLLDPAAPARPALQRGYDDAMQLVYGEQPTMAQCLRTIHDHADLL